MRVLFSFNNIMFVTEIDEECQINDYMDKECPFELIADLHDAGFGLEYWKYDSVKPDGIVSATEKGKFYVGNKLFNSLVEALEHLWSKHTKFKVDHMYRFIYNGGTRKGIKRAVKVVSVSPTLINCVDLDTGDPKNYSFSKMKDIEEIK